MQQGFRTKAWIEAISPYVGGKPIEETAREFGLKVDEIVKLASNENPLGIPPTAKAAIEAALARGNRYPDGNAIVLRQKIAERVGMESECVILGDGSDEILEMIAHLVLEPGTSCVYSQYSFSVYELAAQENGAEGREIPAKNFEVDLDAMLQAIDETTRLVFVTNPNNPTGLALSARKLEAFIEKVPSDCVVVVDEAYREFMDEEDRADSIAWVKRFPNVLVTRTFSKAYGLAGLRVGYGVAQKPLIEMLNRIRPPFNVNLLAQEAAAACVDDEAFLQEVFIMNKQGRAGLESFFASLGLKYLPSSTNFILVHVGPQALAIQHDLLARGVIVRPMTGYGLPEYLRISVGKPEENEKFMTAFKALLEQYKG